MPGPSRDPEPERKPADESAGRQAASRAGASRDAPRTPGFLTPPEPPSLSNSPELRKLLFVGAGLAVLIAVTFSLAPDSSSQSGDPQSQVAQPKAVESPEERQQRLLTSFDGALARVSDGGDFEESGPYLDMVRWMARTSDVYVHQRATDQSTGAPLVFDWNKAIQTPALVRGEFVRVRGLISRIDTVKLMTPAGDVTDVYRFYVCETDGSEPTVIDLIKRPKEDPEIRRDVVDIEAVYFRNVSFESEKTNQRVELPYLIGRSLSVYAAPTGGLGRLHGKTLWAVLAGIVVIAVFIAMRASRQSQSRRRHPALANKEGVSMRALFEMRLREDAARKAAAKPEQKPPILP